MWSVPYDTETLSLVKTGTIVLSDMGGRQFDNNMKKFVIGFGILIVLAIVLGSFDWDRNAKSDDNSPTCDNKLLDSSNDDSVRDGKCLNDIRFANFKKEDWLDNEYIRCLREYIDDYNAGKVDDEIPDQYKEKLKGKFIVLQTQPYLMGGLFIQLVAVDHPEELFHAWVYSFVDEESETVFSYEVRDILLFEEKSGFTKEEIFTLLKEHPEQKLW